MSDIFQSIAPDHEAPPIYACATFSVDEAQFFGNTVNSTPSDAIFDLGSITKIFSSTSMMMKLVENGTIELDAPVAHYLPYPLFERFSIRDLLMHRSGLWEWWPLYAELENSDQVLEFLSEKELRYEPQTEWHYSDLGFILLGEVIKVSTKSDLKTLFAELVSRPLGLEHTTFADPTSYSYCVPSSFGDRAEFGMLESNSPYPINLPTSTFKHWRTHILHGEINDGNAFHLFGGVSSHAGLFASLADLVIFGQELLKKEYFTNLDLFTESGIDPVQALGFRRFGSNFDTFGHTGYPGTAIVISPKSGKGFAFGTNRLLVSGTPMPIQAFISQLLASLL